MYDYDLIVIGGGSGGLVAAQLAKELGAKVALIDKERLGGDCLYAGCVPSKTLIHTARIAHTIRHSGQRGIASSVPSISMPQVAATIAGVTQQIGDDEQSYVQGVDVRFGKAQFIDAHTLTLDGTPLTAKSFIIATGSRPAIPAIPGLTEAGFMTNEDVFDLNALPRSLVIIGGGPVGCELGQAFANLGTQVTIIQQSTRLLPKEDPETSAIVQTALVADGVQVLTQTVPQQITTDGRLRSVMCRTATGETITITATAILVATGRQPQVDELQLQRANVKYTAAGIAVDAKLRTSTSHIFAIGDVIGGYFYTHVAAAQAGVAAPNALLPGLLARTMSYAVVPRVTFTTPEVAAVGLTEEAARQKFGAGVRVQTQQYHHIDRAQTEGKTIGYIKLILGKGDVIIGAQIVGANAGDVLGEVTLAIRHKMKVNDIIATIHAYPTYTTGLQQAAFAAYLTGSSFRSAARFVKRLLPQRK